MDTDIGHVEKGRRRLGTNLLDTHLGNFAIHTEAFVLQAIGLLHGVV